MVRTTPDNHKLFGGRLCLDFANTVDWTPDFQPFTPESTDVLVSGDWAARWAARLGIAGRAPISDGEVERLRDLRLELHRAFSGVDEDMSRLRAALAEALEAGTLGRGGPAWPDDERRLRFAVAFDAFDLLADHGQLARVRRCPGKGCGWLFFDESGRRRWCSMGGCGSREKARRAYERRRVRRTSAPG